MQKALHHHLFSALGIGLIFSVTEFIQPSNGTSAEFRDLLRPFVFAIIIWTFTLPVTVIILDAHEKYCLQYFKLPLSILLALSAFIASFPLSFLIPWLIATLELGGLERNLSVMNIDLYEQFIFTRYLKVTAIVTVIWVLANYHWYKTRQERKDTSRSPKDHVNEANQTETNDPGIKTQFENTTKKPTFLSLSKKTLGSDIYLIAAEQHYIRVVTKLGEDMILYRFSDAVREMEQLNSAGKQIHRSFWVHPNGIVKIEPQNRSYQIRLTNDDVIPVSRSSKALVDQSGWIKTD
ncbi:LytTR family DNA-binding domain-containing protein [Curvivirga aplysinae]|uniref:LytTR family DNA-binding domain-containing protein n=1 Tax=Curvivirga aplysinae TaxID=2529852 RepID=UPI0012BC5C6A|nr:LytTR family DNA-binding domain-containing protein [Curvivirga aplysinae]MTI11474.1 LytTR family transcriptional regulator [Curvivirga aplysinae]